jgi:hypothetical protein
MPKIIVYLAEQECNALLQLAQREMRVPRAQAALIIRQELRRLGMLQAQTTVSEEECNEPQEQGVSHG